VLDNLIARGETPPTLGVFVTPGNLGDHYPGNLGMRNPDHRAAGYDSLSEMISANAPRRRPAVAGSGSGGRHGTLSYAR
jgi:hypothetical protein